jgi:hypothetical protein
MTTRNRISLSEKQAALIWQQAVGKELPSTQDEPLNVVYPGRINGDNGPDFRDAVIGDGLRLTKGDVEVHVRSSDWYNHEHHRDPAYNNVILHVAVWDDCGPVTLLESGKSVPLLCLAQALGHQAYLLPDRLSCFQILDRMDEQTLVRILNSAGAERFKQKAAYFQVQILDTALRIPGIREAAGQVLYRGMMRALGYTKNTKPFEELAGRVPLDFLERSEGLAAKQALLLGTAGLLPSQRRHGEFATAREVRELEQIWESAGGEMKTMREGDWNFSHIYPNNSPVRRVVAQSYVLERYSDKGLLARILELVKDTPPSGGYRLLQHGLTVASHGYWRAHFDFDVRSRTRISALLGHSKAGELVVNVVLPFAFAWAEPLGEAKLTDSAMDLYRSYPRLAENCITRHMVTQLCLKESSDFTACSQQGLIHIFKNYCREGGCSQCPLVG